MSNIGEIFFPVFDDVNRKSIESKGRWITGLCLFLLLFFLLLLLSFSLFDCSLLMMVPLLTLDLRSLQPKNLRFDYFAFSFYFSSLFSSLFTIFSHMLVCLCET